MKISELVEKLIAHKDFFGDLDVVCAKIACDQCYGDDVEILAIIKKEKNHKNKKVLAIM